MASASPRVVVFDGTEDGVPFVPLQLAYVDVTQEGARQSLEMLGRFHQPPKHHVRQ